VIFAGIDTKTVGDMASIAGGLPAFHLPEVPLNWETLQIILPYSVILAAIGLIESLLTLNLIDTMTDTRGKPNRASIGQGVANVVTGFFGGMGGCAMIGQTMINVKASGARTRLSTFLAGVFLLILVVGFGDVVALIPMAALVAVMIMVSIGTFSWGSIANLKKHPLSTSIVMVTTVVVVVTTHNLAIGVFVGVLLAAMFFANKVAQYKYVTSSLSEDGTTRTYRVVGQVFFASADKFVDFFDFREVIDSVVIDLCQAHFWDITAVAALDKAVLKFRREGTAVEVIGLNEASATIVDRFAVHDKPGAVDSLMGH
jgi:SulP family sulfate permease